MKIHASPEKGKGVRLRCRACCAVVSLVAAGGPAVQDVGFEHEGDCGFLAAVNDGATEDWIDRYGYPIEMLTGEPS